MELNILKAQQYASNIPLRNEKCARAKNEPSLIDILFPLWLGQRHWYPSVLKVGFLTCVIRLSHPFLPQIGGICRKSPRLRI